MVTFKQKEFTEYDAMKILYKEMVNRAQGDRRRFPKVCNSSALIPILKGANIVVERFVISDSFFGKDKYRMYLKIGAKAKLPDRVKLPGEYYIKNIGNLGVNFNSNLKIFSDDGSNNKPNKNSQGGGEKAGNFANANFRPNISLQREELHSLGEVLEYDKIGRSLVLEFENVGKAVSALSVLPFGLNYDVYLLDS